MAVSRTIGAYIYWTAGASSPVASLITGGICPSK